MKEISDVARLTTTIPDDYKKAIGEVVIQWARLEFTVEYLIWRVLRLDEEDGRAITSRLDMKPKTEMLVNLAERYFSPKEATAKLKDYVSHIAHLHKLRNRIIHGFWAIVDEETAIATSPRLKAPSGYVTAQQYSLKFLGEMAADIETINRSFLTLLDELEPSDDTRPSQSR